MTGGSSVRMVAFNGSNWAIWKARMEDFLCCKDLQGPLLGDGAKPEKMSVKEWRILDRKTVGYIRQWICDNVYHNVAQEKTAHSLWKRLEKLYETKNANNKAFLMKRLVNLKYVDGNPVADHMNDFQNISNQLTSMNINLEDELQALFLLSSFPESWETLVVSLSNSAPNGVVSMEQVSASILNEELRRRNAGTSSGESQALVSENRGRGKSRDKGHADKGRSKSKSRKDIVCYNCGEKGHFKSQCKQSKKNKKKNQEGDDGGAKEIIATTQDGDFLILSTNEDVLSCECQDSEWVADTGASLHATPRRESFCTYRSGQFGVVRMGNKGISNIVGIGDVKIKTNLGYELLLKDVRHVADLRLNLLSIGRLDDEGFESRFGGGRWKLKRGSLVLASARKSNTLYKLAAQACSDEVNAAEKDPSMELWHRRLGHMSEKGLQALSRRNVLPDFKGTRLNPCVDCLAGKQHRVSFASPKVSRKPVLLDRIYSDVCGPLKTKTPHGAIDVHGISGALYFVTFIDDCSRKVWAYPLKTKDQVVDVFKEFHVRVERETGQKLKCIRSDNGGEYMGSLDSYCKKQGIRHEVTVPGTPQHNAVAERMNRTIMERIRSMLSHAKLPKRFWDEALRTAVDLINLSPSIPLDGDVAEHAWSGKEVSYKHLKVFGCRAFAHVPDVERSKLDGKTKECVFLVILTMILGTGFGTQ